MALARGRRAQRGGERRSAVWVFPYGLLTNVQSEFATVALLGMGPDTSGVETRLANTFEPRALSGRSA
jgi:hypothetical protein